MEGRKLSLRVSSGEVINEKDACKSCKGRKVLKEVKYLEVDVDKGMRDNERIIFRGEGDQQVGAVARVHHYCVTVVRKMWLIHCCAGSAELRWAMSKWGGQALMFAASVFPHTCFVPFCDLCAKLPCCYFFPLVPVFTVCC